MVHKENKFWEIVGKLSLLVVIVGGIITIYFQLISNDKPILVVRGHYNSYSYPPDLIDGIKNYESSISYDSLEAYLSQYETRSKSKMENKYDLTGFFKNKLAKFFEEYRYLSDKNKYNGFFYFNITNEGKRPSNDIIFTLPIKGIALFTRDNDNQKVIVFNKEIKFNELRPYQSIKLAVWSENYYYSYYDEDEFKISDKEGVGSVSFSKEVNGIEKFISDYFIFFVYLIIILSFGFFGYIIDLVKSSAVTINNEKSDESK